MLTQEQQDDFKLRYANTPSSFVTWESIGKGLNIQRKDMLEFLLMNDNFVKECQKLRDAREDREAELGYGKENIRVGTLKEQIEVAIKEIRM